MRLRDGLYHVCPDRKIAESRGLLNQYWRDLELFAVRELQKRRQNLDRCLAQLDGLSPLGVLARGYSISTTLPKGEVVRSIRQVREDDRIRVRFHEGAVQCNVIKLED
jgi:exodeoxyribonuclease VII large subunit